MDFDICKTIRVIFDLQQMLEDDEKIINSLSLSKVEVANMVLEYMKNYIIEEYYEETENGL